MFAFEFLLIKGWAVIDLFGLDQSFRKKISADFDWVFVLAISNLNPIDCDFGVQNVGATEDGGDPTVGLRHIARAIVDIQVGPLPVDSA